LTFLYLIREREVKFGGKGEKNGRWNKKWKKRDEMRWGDNIGELEDGGKDYMEMKIQLNLIN